MMHTSQTAAGSHFAQTPRSPRLCFTRRGSIDQIGLPTGSKSPQDQPRQLLLKNQHGSLLAKAKNVSSEQNRQREIIAIAHQIVAEAQTKCDMVATKHLSAKGLKNKCTIPPYLISGRSKIFVN
eukprot:1094399-Amphidinium_carterae.1